MSAVNDRPTTLDVEPADTTERDTGAGTGNLEKVRDILFGHQMREVDRRFVRLEERIVKETRDLREDMKRRLDALEAYTNKETEALSTQLRNEQAERVDANARLVRELADTAGALERRTAALDEQLAKGQREIRQHILEQQQRLKCAFDGKGLLNPGKVFPTLHRCAELGRLHVHAGRVAFPDIPRF